MSGESIEKRVLTDHGGRFVVLIIYVAVVILAGGWGYLLGSLGIKSLRPVSLFFLFTLQPTPSGLAVYGMGTLGVGLGVMLLLVNYVSQHYDMD
nr:cox cluster protein [Halococcus salsus]